MNNQLLSLHDAGLLEDAAEILAALTSGSLGNPTLYTEAQLERKMRTEKMRTAIREEDIESSYHESIVFSTVVESLIDAANLTVVQSVVFRMAASGASACCIAEMVGIRRQSACRILKAARVKIATAACEGPYAGWYEVYLSEVRRSSRKR